MNKTQKLAGGIGLGAAVLVGGAIGGVAATSSNPKAAVIVQRADSSTPAPTTTVPLPAPTTTAPAATPAPAAAPVTTLAPNTDPVSAANSAANSANSAAQSAASAANSATQAQAAATPGNPSVTVTTGTTPVNGASASGYNDQPPTPPTPQPSPVTTDIPDVVGENVVVAFAQLTAAGLKWEPVTGSNCIADGVTPDTVIAQSEVGAVTNTNGTVFITRC